MSQILTLLLPQFWSPPTPECSTSYFFGAGQAAYTAVMWYFIIKKLNSTKIINMNEHEHYVQIFMFSKGSIVSLTPFLK